MVNQNSEANINNKSFMSTIRFSQSNLPAHAAFMEKFFRKNIKKYFPGAEFVSLDAKLCRSSFEKNFLLRYTLRFKKNYKNLRKIVWGKSVAEIGNHFDCSRIAYLTSKYLWGHGFKNLIPRPLDYLNSLHLFIYEGATGVNFEEKIHHGEVRPLLSRAPAIAKLLKKFHQTKFRVSRVRNRSFENFLDRHHLFLVKKFGPAYYKKFRKFLYATEEIGNQNKIFPDTPGELTLAHGDFHPGNILLDKKTVKFIDLGSTSMASPMLDVGNFLMQTELMLRLRFYPRHLRLVSNLHSAFLKAYFGRTLTPEENFKLLYFEIKCLLQVMAVIVLLWCQHPERQRKALSAFFEILEKRYNKFVQPAKTL